MMGIYTTLDHINIRKRCTDIEYGQVGNENLHSGLTRNQNYSAPLRCRLQTRSRPHCTGNITMKDFIPRSFSLLLGFHCDEITEHLSLEFFLNNTNLTFLAFLYKIYITEFQNQQKKNCLHWVLNSQYQLHY